MNIMVIGAHPDDCEYYAAGTAVKCKKKGHRIKFVSVSNGDAGHHSMERSALAATPEQNAHGSDDRVEEPNPLHGSALVSGTIGP